MIYVLLLQEEKLYVGYSARPVGKRFIDHFNYRGSRWTTLYRPLEVLFVKDGGPDEENEVTLELMAKYGWWNVRGGSWCQVEMNSCPPALLERKCLKLPTPLKQNGVTIKKSSIKTSNQLMHTGRTMKKGSDRAGCGRCGRNSHSSRDCFAKIDIFGQSLEDIDSANSSSSTSDESDFDDGCYRCGRNSHFARDCFATTDIDGNYI